MRYNVLAFIGYIGMGYCLVVSGFHPAACALALVTVLAAFMKP